MLKVKEDYREAKEKHNEVIRLLKQCKEKVIAENEFHTTEGERLNLLNDYLMNDADSIKYWKLCFKEYKKVGLNPKNYEHNVEWDYTKRLRAAENALIAWGKLIIATLDKYKAHAKDLKRLYNAINYDLYFREKVIKLTLKLKED